jgi:phosphoenolpyruvate synthase/pyruvate phosphate dikinase
MREVLGRGTVVSGEHGSGLARIVTSGREAAALMSSDDLEGVILVTNSATVTGVVPLLPRIRGVVCTGGGSTSHLALVSREFGLLCVMGAALDEIDGLDGVQIAISSDGTVSRL